MKDSEILIVADSQTKFDIENEYSERKKIFGDLDIYTPDEDAEKLNKYYLKELYKEPINLASSNHKFLYLVESKLFNNVYYPIDTYYECYENDFKYLLSHLSKNIGAKYIEIIIQEEKINIEELEKKMSSKFNLIAGKLKIGVGSNKSIISKLKETTKREVKYKEDIKEVHSLSKEDFKKMIEDENINIYALMQIKSKIDEYMLHGKITGNIEIEEFKLDHVVSSLERYVDTAVKISGAHIPKFLSNVLNSSMNLKFSSNASREIKYSKSLKININF